MPENTNTQSAPQRPIYIDPNARRSKFPKPLAWILGCLGGCFILSVITSVIFSGFLAMIAAGSSVNLYQDVIKDGNPKEQIAVVPINGVILDSFDQQNNLLGFGSSSTTNSRVETYLDMASNDNSVQAIILRLNTPGGSTLAMRKICKKVESINKNKPVYAYIESEGASAGYYIANCTRYIVADDQAITGSIGALVEATDIKGLLDKLGIKTKVVTNTQGVNKDSDLFTPNSNVEQKVKGILDIAFEDFIRQVVKGRNANDNTSKISEQKIRQLATGEIFSGKAAKDNGLVDENGMFDDMINIVKSKEVLTSDVRVIQYSYSQGFFSNVGSTFESISRLSDPIAVPVMGVYSIANIN